MRKTWLIFISLFILVINGKAQQSTMYTQYMFNGLAINPAYAGYDGLLSLTALGRLQSVGLEGSPDTQMFTAHAPIINKKIGVGIQFFHEKIGVTEQTGIYGSYSYKIYMEKFTLSFGLQAGVNFYNTNYTSLITFNPGDPVFNEDIRSVTPNMGSGIILSNQRLFVGISMPQMLSAGSQENVIVQEKPLILYGGYAFQLSPGVILKPSMLAKMVNGKPIEWNINAHILIKDILWLGASFRPVNAISLLMQIQITEQLAFGYAYDASVGEISTIEAGSHEIMLNYKFRFSKKGVISPRYF